MLKKSIIALGLSALLTVPAGVALAADDVVDDTRVPVALYARDQVRSQTQDPGTCGTCAFADDDAYPIRDQARLQDQTRLQDPALCDGTGQQHRGQFIGTGQAGDGFGYGAGRAGNGSGLGYGYGPGTAAGAGPIHDGLGDANRFGLAGQ